MMLSVNICKQHNYSNKAQNNNQLMVMVIDNVSNPGIVLFMTVYIMHILGGKKEKTYLIK